MSSRSALPADRRRIVARRSARRSVDLFLRWHHGASPGFGRRGRVHPLLASGIHVLPSAVRRPATADLLIGAESVASSQKSGSDYQKVGIDSAARERGRLRMRAERGPHRIRFFGTRRTAEAAGGGAVESDSVGCAGRISREFTPQSSVGMTMPPYRAGCRNGKAAAQMSRFQPQQ